MRVVTVSVGVPREVLWNGRVVTTGIFKEAVKGPVTLRRHNLDGDQQADLTVHGGPNKAVYAYPLEHYGYWAERLPGRDLPMGSFGENLTTEGLLESAVCVGDRFRIGTAEVVVTQPRMPCYKLGIKFESDAMIKLFLESRRSGLYLAVLSEGEVGAGDSIERLSHEPDAVCISEVVRLYLAKTYGEAETSSVRRLLQTPALPESWKEYFLEKLERAEG